MLVVLAEGRPSASRCSAVLAEELATELPVLLMRDTSSKPPSLRMSTLGSALSFGCGVLTLTTLRGVVGSPEPAMRIA